MWMFNVCKLFSMNSVHCVWMWMSCMHVKYTYTYTNLCVVGYNWKLTKGKPDQVRIHWNVCTNCKLKPTGMSQLQLKMFHQSDSRFLNSHYSRFASQQSQSKASPAPPKKPILNITKLQTLLLMYVYKCRRKFASLTANFPFAHICYYLELVCLCVHCALCIGAMLYGI